MAKRSLCDLAWAPRPGQSLLDGDTAEDCRLMVSGTPADELTEALPWRVFGADRHPLAGHPRITWITQ